MTVPERTYAVLGASGGIGSHIVEVLAADHRAVRTVGRTRPAERPGVQPVAADLRDPAQVRTAIDGADVMFHAAQPAYTRWPQEFPSLTDSIAVAAAAAGDRLFDATLAGRRATTLGSLDQPHSWSYLPDVAAALVRLADAPQAGGRAWHLPVAEPLAQREFMSLVFRAAGQQPQLATLPGPAHRMIGVVNPLLRELHGTRWQFTHPFTVDWSAFAAEIGPFTPTPHTEAVKATLAWLQERSAGTHGRAA